MPEHWVFQVLKSELQVRKHTEVQRYLRDKCPNQWFSLSELDTALPDGARLANFPPEWIQEMERECSRRGSNFKMEIVERSAALVESDDEEQDVSRGGQPTREVRLRFDAAHFNSREELLDLLRCTSETGIVGGLSTGTGMVRSQGGDAAIKDGVLQKQLYMLDLDAVQSRQGTKRGGNSGAGGGGANEGAEGQSDAYMQLAEGMVDIGAWMQQGAPVKVHSACITPRGVQARQDGFPSEVRLGDRVALQVGRSLVSAPAEEDIRIRFTIRGKNPEGLRIEPAADLMLKATAPHEAKMLNLRVAGTGAYSIRINVESYKMGPAGQPVRGAIRTEVMAEVNVVESASYNADKRFALYHKEVECPVSLLPSHTLCTTSLGKPTAPKGECWWADASPLMRVGVPFISVSGEELKQMESAMIVNAVPIDVKAGRARDGDDEAGSQKKKKRTRNFEDLANTHMLHHGVDLTKPYVVPK